MDGTISSGSAPTSSPDGASADRLDSWKEIAAYLKRDVTTVQRWEKREGMPVLRHQHDRGGSVYASRAALDAWTRSRSPAAADDSNGALPSAATEAGEESMPSAGAKARGQAWWWLAGCLLATAALAAGVLFALQRREYFWKSPIAGAQFQTITDFDGIAEAAAISRDGRLIAFLSDRDGPMDVWVTQVGSGEYHNLTHGGVGSLVNPLVRTPSFSPDASLVSFWVRRPPEGSHGGETDTWAVPTLGGQARPYLDGAAEFDWSPDGSQLAFHTSSAGDPLFVAEGGRLSDKRLLFTAGSGLHSHFPLWSPDGRFLYFVHGSVPDKLDVWRISPKGGTPERITAQNRAVMYPVMLDERTLLYLATEADGSGPWLYSMDVERRLPHRLTWGPERYTSLAASADGHQLAVTLASPKRTLWRLNVADPIATEPRQIQLSTGTGFAPRLGPNYLLYVSTAGTGEGIWKFANGAATQLWHASGAHLIGTPAISDDGRLIAFSVRQGDRSSLNVMQADGAGAHVVADTLDLDGSPAWSPDGRSLTTAAKDHGTPRLLRVSLDGGSPTVLVTGYSLDPAWSPDGRLVLYSGADIGTTFAVKALAPGGSAAPPRALTLTRGARHLILKQGGVLAQSGVLTRSGTTVVFLQGDIDHKDVWEMDLETGVQRRLTQVPPGFDVRDFDLSPDGREILLERVQERSDVMLLQLPRR